MRLALFAAAMAASVSAGAAAAVVDLRPPHVDMTALAGAQNPPMCEPTKFNVYFENGQARLTEPAERTLDVVSHQIGGCTISVIGVEAAATDVASAEGRHIAGLRGAAVLKALQERGINPDAVVVRQVGSPNEPHSVMPQHITIAIDASRTPVTADRKALGDNDV